MTLKTDLIKISVIIPMYNNENTIIDTLESVRNQSVYKCIHEIIIINDGSTDNSKKVVENYSDENKNLPIKLINKENGGVSSARNIGVLQSNGNFIALLDSDDIWLPSKIEMQIKTFIQYPEIDFLGGGYNNTKLKILNKNITTLYKASLKDLCLKSFPATPTVMFKRKIIEEIGLFDEAQRYAEDTNYFMKICSKFNYYYLPENMVVCGSGKPTFGFSGLSSNLIEMHKGTIINIKYLKNKSLISLKFYIFLRLFYHLKHVRRTVLTKKRIFSK